jgi:hypothetical protein
MTDMWKITKRRTVKEITTIPRRLIVALMPGDVIAFREEGRRKWYQAPIGKVFVQVATWNATAETAERKRKKKGFRRED